MYLNNHTYYSLRYGTLSPQRLVEEAQKRKVKTMVLTDINNTSCAYEFVKHCEAMGIKPVLGVEFRVDKHFAYLGIARNREGFRELNELLSRSALQGKPIPLNPPPMPNVYIVFPRLIKPIEQFEDNEFMGIRPEHVHRLFSSNLLQHRHKLVALSPVTFLDKEGANLHRLLRAIDLNTLITKLSSKDIAKPTELFHYPAILQQLYEKYPFISRNTQQLLDHCTTDLRPGLHNNRQTFTGSEAGDFALLEKLAINGCRRRYGEEHSKAAERTRRELKVIREQGFCPYFLITWDIVRYAQAANYHYVGRGSGANSIVAYALYITDVDPLELDLYFERFINPHRSAPPDFDIDFSWQERDDVIDYIIKRYGQKHTALLATYNTFKGRSIYRELGKVFGLPKAEIDTLVNTPEKIEQHTDIVKQIIHYGEQMENFPNYLSIHAGGIVISEEPINYFTALQMMPKGFPITHFDMYHGEALGFHKFDVLSQRGIGHIKDAVEWVKQNQGRAIDIHEVEKIKTDPKVKAQLRSGQCTGCFYIESPAMRGLLQKLRCDNYNHLVAASSIIRPGVAQSGMMRTYIQRFHHPQAFKYIHPIFEEHLGETFGVMVYQEDVMKIVHHFAGLGLDESDVLRRIMTGKKFQGDTFQLLRKKYFENCKAKGYSEELTLEVWRQIESFSGYSFCKAHSASFAVESFQSLYLKAYYPLEFMVAVINNFGGFYHTEYYFHEARISGANIHAPCVNESDYLTNIKGIDIYIGFIHLHQMEREVAKNIISQRKANGPFRHLEDFIHRVKISAEQLDILIRIGAFRFTGKHKYALMWEKNAFLNPRQDLPPALSLFEDPFTTYTLPPLEETPYDQVFDEIELLGFPLCSPFELLSTPEQQYDCLLAADFPKQLGCTIHVLGYYVCKKDLTTSKGQWMAFGTWLDRDGLFFDTTHFPNFLRLSPFQGKGIYRITGKVVAEFGFYSLEVIKMVKLAFVVDRRYE